MEKTFKIVNGDMSDGYHTFDELYDHRCLLFINWMISDGAPGIAKVVEEHFEGWDLIFCQTSAGQISYHVPNKFRELYKMLNRVPSNPEFDGHTSADVVERLKKLAV
jgi:hypothetical protein